MARTYSAEYVTKLKLDYKEATRDLDEFQKEYSKLEKQVQDQNNATAKSIKNIEKSSGSAAKGIKGIGGALKGAGIGLAIAAFAKLTEVFNENQKVTDFFSTTFEALSLAFNDFFNFISDNAGSVVGFFKSLFDDPVQSLKNFGKAIFENIIERVKSSLDALGFLGEAVVKVFKGDFAGAAESAKEAGKELLDVVTGVDNSFEKAAEIVPKIAESVKNYAVSTVQAAKANVELNKTAEVAAVVQQGLIEKYDRQAEQLRQIRDDESRTIEERIEANNKLGAVLDEQEAAMLKQVQLQIASAQAQYDKNQNQENYIALLEAQNEEEAVLAQIEGFRSEQLTNINSLERERQDLIDENLEKAKEAAEAETDAKRKASEEQRQIQEQLAQASQEALQQGISGAVALIGENSKFAKGIAIAQAIRDTYAGATKALAQGGIFGAIGAAGIIASGIANVKAITATKDPAAPSFAPTASGGSVPAPPIQAQAPAFNVVGGSGIDQLAETIAGSQAKPQRAYVVANDVTTAQGLDRNIVEGASI
jgi:hypothetical protein